MSPKRRSNSFPPYTRIVSGAVYWRPRVKPGDGLPADKGGFLAPPIRLGLATDAPEAIWAAYSAAKARLQTQKPGRGTLRQVLDLYFSSPKFSSLAPKTQRDHRRRARIIDEQRVRYQGADVKLAEVPLSALTTRHFQAILEKRLAHWQAEGRKGQAEANHEMRLLSAAV